MSCIYVCMDTISTLGVEVELFCDHFEDALKLAL